MLDQRDHNVRLDDQERGFVLGAGFNTFASTSGRGANSLLTWLVEVWENKWPLLNEVKMIAYSTESKDKIKGMKGVGKQRCTS